MLRVKEIAREKGLTIAQVAEKTDMLPPALSRIINGSNTTIETLEKIANALNVPISELFDRPANDNTITCPNCGTRLEVKKKE
jgi:transcriptional regulator with XRE-family HTH domain